jgi:hypothetical protein
MAVVVMDGLNSKAKGSSCESGKRAAAGVECSVIVKRPNQGRRNVQNHHVILATSDSGPFR